MENIKQHDHRTTRRPDCVTEIRMGNTVLVVSGFFNSSSGRLVVAISGLLLRYRVSITWNTCSSP